VGIEALGPIASSDRVTGARLRDALTGSERDVEVSAVLVVQPAAQPEVSSAFALADRTPAVPVMSLVFDRPARDIALIARTPTGRSLMMLPWRGRTVVHARGVMDDAASGGAIDQLLADIKATFPSFDATASGICRIQQGVVPAERRAGRLAPRSAVVVSSDASRVRGVVTLAGGSSVLARVGARRAVDAVTAHLSRHDGRRQRHTDVLPYAGIADTEGRLVEVARELHVAIDPDVATHLMSWYGTEATDVVRFAASKGLLDRVALDSPVMAGEIVYGAVQAGGRRLTDVVLRRTPLGAAGHPGPAALERAASLMGDALGWPANRKAAEIADLERAYPAPATQPTGR
jgi:glycerol-3-phosphate dehydrogenase